MKLMDRTLGKNVGAVRTCYWVGRGPHPAGPGQGGESGEKLYFNESFHQQRVERPPAQPSPAHDEAASLTFNGSLNEI